MYNGKLYITLHSTFSLNPSSGGDKGSRTPDLLRARQALYQLSYVPIPPPFSWWDYQDLNLGPHPYQGCALTN